MKEPLDLRWTFFIAPSRCGSAQHTVDWACRIESLAIEPMVPVPFGGRYSLTLSQIYVAGDTGCMRLLTQQIPASEASNCRGLDAFRVPPRATIAVELMNHSPSRSRRVLVMMRLAPWPEDA